MEPIYPFFEMELEKLFAWLLMALPRHLMIIPPPLLASVAPASTAIYRTVDLPTRRLLRFAGCSSCRRPVIGQKK